MMIRARAVGATLLLSGLGLVVACSSSSDDKQPQGGAGAGASSSGDAGEAGSSDGGSPNPSGGKSGGAGMTAAGADGGGEAGTGGTGAVSGGGAAGAGGEAGAGDACAACESGLCLATGECVECLAGNDQCATGTYCGPDNTCISGCKDDDSCASGVCDADHNCQSCLGDEECSEPQVCGNNQCADPCTAAQEGGSAGCGVGLTCCSLHCVDATTDSAHCGACGTACAAGQFCGTGGCADATLAAACSVGKIAVVLDNSAGMGNWGPTRQIAAALKATCIPAPTTREISEDVADVVNASTGRPVAGGDELLVAAGGSFFARLVNYVSTEPIAPIYSVLNGATLEYRRRSTGALVASEPFAEDPAHDIFVVQFFRDPSSGSLILNAQGFWQNGTKAAAFHFENAMLPVLPTLTKAWYVFEWTDANADAMPQAGESVLITSGN